MEWVTPLAWLYDIRHHWVCLGKTKLPTTKSHGAHWPCGRKHNDGISVNKCIDWWETKYFLYMKVSSIVNWGRKSAIWMERWGLAVVVLEEATGELFGCSTTSTIRFMEARAAYIILVDLGPIRSKYCKAGKHPAERVKSGPDQYHQSK